MAGRKEKITKRAVDLAVPTDKIYRLWDSELKGFGLKVMPSGIKTYIVVYRPNGGGRSQPLKEFTLGRHGPLTPDDARREARLKLGEVEAGADPQEDRKQLRAEMTVSELCDRYMQDGVGTKKPSTLRSDQSRIDCHIKPLLGAMRVSQVKGTDIERFLRDVANGKTAAFVKPPLRGNAGKQLKKENTRRRTDSSARGGKGTASRTVGFLGGIFTFAIKHKMRSDNPVHGVQRYKDSQSQRYLNAEELGRLGAALEALDGHDQGVAVIRLLSLTGARKGEIEGLKWSEIDFDFGYLRLEDSKTGQKLVPLGAPALLLLSSIKRTANSPYVFPAREQGTKLKTPHYVGTPRIWEDIKAKADLEGVRLHDLRHTFASLAAGGGQSLPMIGKILGHADVKTTARYAHLADDPVKLAVNRVAETAAAALAGKSGEAIQLRSSKA